MEVFRRNDTVTMAMFLDDNGPVKESYKCQRDLGYTAEYERESIRQDDGEGKLPGVPASRDTLMLAEACSISTATAT